MEIRQAELGDEEAVCRLWTVLLKFYNKQASPEILQQSFHYAVEHPHKVLIFIVLVEGVITGTASLHLGHYSTWNDNWYGHIEDVVVDPDYRGRGLAEKLVSHIIAVATEKKLARLELNALVENDAARRLYEKVGFSTDSVAYELNLKQ